MAAANPSSSTLPSRRSRTTTNDAELGADDSVRVRKSAFGRTSLFLSQPGVLLRTVRSSTSVGRRANGSVYHRLSDAERNVDRVCCWHCCEWIEGEERYRAPRVYDPFEKVYYVYGFFCSPECTKAHILEVGGFDRGHQVGVFVQMMREVYDNHAPILEAPPRISLRRFGGPFDIANVPKTACKVVQPPFVSYCMLVEEASLARSADTLGTLLPPAYDETCPDLEVPSIPGMLEDYVREREEGARDEAGGAEEEGGQRTVLGKEDVAPAEARATEERGKEEAARRTRRKVDVSASAAPKQGGGSSLRRFAKHKAASSSSS